MKTKLLVLSLLTQFAFAQNHAYRKANLASPAEEVKIKVMVKQANDLETEARRKAIIALQQQLGLDVLTASSQDFSREEFEKYRLKLKVAYNNKLQEFIGKSDENVDLYMQKVSLEIFNSKSESAGCLNNLLQRNLVPTQDADGQEIVAYDLAEYRNNLRYKLVDNYYQGFARICKDKKYGFVNICGKEAIEAIYEYAEPFNSGKAAVQKDQDWYFVNTEGYETEEPLKDISEIKALKNGISIAKFKNGRYALINNDYDRKAKPLSAYFDEIAAIGGDFVKVRVGKIFGVMRIDGVIIIEPTYNDIVSYWEGLFGVKAENNKIGYINQKGKVKITFDYSEIKTSPNGLAIATKDGNKWGVINKMNARIIPCEFKEVSFTLDSKINVVGNDKEAFVLNLEGDCLNNCEKFEVIRKKANLE
jgi:WG containing repeat